MMASLRPGRADDLGLRRALSDRLLPLLVGAMVFLAALAGAGSLAAAGLAARWRGAGGATMVQVPQPGARSPDAGPPGRTRAAAAGQVLGPTARLLSPSDVAALLRPWLGDDAARLSVPLPAVFILAGGLQPDVQAELEAAAPDTLVAHDSAWQERLAALAGSLQACAALALAVVGLVAAAIVAVATRAGLSARRDAVEIVHGLGATDAMIAGRFSTRVTGLAFAGAVAGTFLAAGVLLGLARLAAPFQAASGTAGPVLAPLPAGAILSGLPSTVWALLAGLPVLASAIGWATAQATVRSWLGRLP